MRDYLRKPFAPLFEKSGLLPPTRRVDELKKTADFITIAPRTINNSSPKQRLIKCKAFTLTHDDIFKGWGRLQA